MLKRRSVRGSRGASGLLVGVGRSCQAPSVVATAEIFLVPVLVLEHADIGSLRQKVVSVHLLPDGRDGTRRGSDQTGRDHEPVLGVLLQLHPHVHLGHARDDVSGNDKVAHFVCLVLSLVPIKVEGNGSKKSWLAKKQRIAEDSLGGSVSRLWCALGECLFWFGACCVSVWASIPLYIVSWNGAPVERRSVIGPPARHPAEALSAHTRWLT